MKKYIDKLLYFFGYAPIKLSHEIKYINIHRGVELDILRSEKKITLWGFEKNIENRDFIIKCCKEEIMIEFIDAIKNHVLFEVKEKDGNHSVKGSVLIKKPEA